MLFRSILQSKLTEFRDQVVNRDWRMHHEWVIRRLEAGQGDLVLSQAKAALGCMEEETDDGD